MRKVASGTEFATEMVTAGQWYDELVKNKHVKKERGGKAEELKGPDDTTKALVDLLNAHNIPAGPVLTVPQILSHPQVTDRNLIARFVDTPGVGIPIDVVTTGFRLDDQRPSVATPPPFLGQHSADILRDLGYCEEDIISMSDEGTI